MESKTFDIVLRPSSAIAQRAIDLSQKLESQGVRFVIDGNTCFPHVSLYMVRLSEVGLDKALRVLSELAKETKQIHATATNYRYQNEYLDIAYGKSTDLSVIQNKVLESINPFRDGLREKDKIRLVTAVGEERESLLKYGYRSVGNQFNPHLTLTRFIESKKEATSSLPQKEIFSGVYEKLAIFEMGDNGTCVREVKSWELN